ncbi:Ras subfamily protein [Acanthamoeba castellanii str. Neff]|uniref:Ras subfamily protein n=1 Tax=Acanthamoeba castellanii (strain ATCC 30010 / Neff) TaxID=1257118 RepID=L8GPS6_ACACF|nr:Ras subfamily protein [Acanthamoeba castellanii str. Neff]ELR14106.1 Ras subfamily protein [Acanthamoeba castellanii str. Neff]
MEEENVHTVQRLYQVFDKNPRGEIDAVGFRQMAWVLGEDLYESEAQACVARLDLDGSGGLSLPELRAWWASHDKAADAGEGATADSGVLPVLLQRLRSTSYVQMAQKEQRRRVVDDHTFRGWVVYADRLKLDAEVGEFGEARSSGSVRFTLDPETAAAARQELKAPPNCVGLISIGCTIRGDIDEFELGELAGSIANLLLMAKPLFKFHSHKTQMGKQNGERLMVLSLFWTDIDELVQIRSALIGAELKEIEGTIELSQKPGDQTDDFVKGRVRGKLAVSVNVVAFLNELLNRYKTDLYRARVNMLAAFRDLDLKLKVDSMDEAYRRFAKDIRYFRDVRGLSSLKQLLLPAVVSLYNDNSIPAPIKDTYFNAVASLRGVASLHLQMDDQVLRFAFDNADVAALLPTKDELASWRAPIPPVTPAAKNLRPLFGTNEYRVAVLGPRQVGKSSLIVQFTQVPRQIQVDGAPVNLELCDAGSEENTQMRWVLLVDAVVLVYSVTDRASFEAMEDWRKRILQTKAGLANKIDQAAAARMVKPEEGAELAAKWEDSLFFEVDATRGESLSSAFLELVLEVKSLEEADTSDGHEWFPAL